MRINKAFIAALMSLAAAAVPASAKTKVVTTIFPEYDWARQIIGDKEKESELTLLLSNGSDLHSYQPSAKDIAKISDADVFVYVGGESDEWVKNALRNVRNKNMQVVNLLDVLGDKVKAEEIVDGMEHEHDHEEHEHSHGKEVSTFDDKDVKDRALSDWAGEWKSPYKYLLEGKLDEAWEEKAESGKMSAEEYKEYYKTGYKTDIDSVSISGDTIKYVYDNGKTASAKYKYVGFYVQNWSSGTKAAMYRFESTDKKSPAPAFVEFNDHMIESAKAEHFHIRMSDESFDAIEDPEKYWPTFFPADMDAEEICDHLAGHEHHHHHDEEMDEHVWLSLKNARILCSAIADALCKADPKNAPSYKSNLAAYEKNLSALDKKFEDAVKGAKTKTILFGDRFPFRYLVDDYGLSYYAAFTGCSAESEASFKTIAFLAGKVDELNLGSVCQIESGNGKIARTIIKTSKNKNAKILTFDSMQSTTKKQIKKGATYLGAMEENLKVLKEALGK